MVLNNQLYTCIALRYLYRAEHGRYTSQYSRGQKSTGSICLIDFCQLCQEETKFCNATLNDEICFLIYFGTYVNVLVYLSIVCRWFDHIGNSCLKINIKSAYGKKSSYFRLCTFWFWHIFEYFMCFSHYLVCYDTAITLSECLGKEVCVPSSARLTGLI